MNEKNAIEETIKFLSDEFIVEECIGNSVEGCLSCEMIEVRSSLRKVLELMDGNWPFTPDQNPIVAHL